MNIIGFLDVGKLASEVLEGGFGKSGRAEDAQDVVPRALVLRRLANGSFCVPSWVSSLPDATMSLPCVTEG